MPTYKVISNILQGRMPPWEIVLFPQCHLSPEYERDDQDQRGLHAAQQSRWLAVLLEKWLYGGMELAGVDGR